MTCIAGLVDNGKVYMGGDSAAMDGYYNLAILAKPKVFRNGEFVFGVSGSGRLIWLLQYAFTPPVHHPDVPLDKYMATSFVDAVRECFKGAGVAEKKNEVESFESVFLVGYRGRLFTLQSDYWGVEETNNFASIGCGGQIALGAMYATPDLPPEQRIRKALEAAERFSAGVRGPFQIEVLGFEPTSPSA